ncbi:MAG: hypothetical protein LQ341_003179 [Variospora aurantia]|nr:MAG: hypothetical protein LQ341_003179 [Variospora aurantia]
MASSWRLHGVCFANILTQVGTAQANTKIHVYLTLVLFKYDPHLNYNDSGGTIVSTLSKSDNELLKNSNFTLLIRGADKARVFNDKGFQTVLFDSLEDTETVENIASKYDLIINNTPGVSVDSATAFIKGLGRRQKSTGRDVYYIHTSGTSNLADQPITKAYEETRTFVDTTPDLYSYLQQRNALTPYAHRTADIAVISTGLALNVKTYIIMPPTIYGTGTGDFNRITIQAPAIIRSALRTGQVMQLGDDNAVAEHVHVEDLAELYIAVANKVIKDGMQGFPSGERGIYFAGTGRHTWGEFTRGIFQALRELNAIKTDQIKKVGLTEAAEMWTGGNELYCELIFGASWRTQADASRKLGWQPQKTEEEFEKHFLDTARLVMESQK